MNIGFQSLFSKQIFSLLLSACLFPLTFSEKEPIAVASAPNVVLFFLDDMGYGDLSVTGALGYQTPNIDRMAYEGTRFTNFLSTQAVCTASRASLLTGCYANRIGMSGALGPNATVGLNPDEETLAELLKAKGYATGIFGKWHLGSQPAFLPLQQGFDEYYGVPYSHDMWPFHPNQVNAKYPPLPLYEGNKVIKIIENLDDAAQLTTKITEKAIGFIQKHRKKPFFMYVPHPLPHVPLAVSAKFKGKSERGLYGDVLMELDWSVGQILAELKQQGLDKNTIVLFASDNGPWLNYGNHAGSSGGFREGKGTSFEGGQRVPLIVRWPGSVLAGRVSDKLLTAMDILPTVAALCSAQMPTRKIDGINFTQLLIGDDTSIPRTEFLYYYKKNNLEAVRKGNWKLVLPHPGRSYELELPGKDGVPGLTTENREYPMALYNLERDPGERYDVSKQFPEIVTALNKIAENARDDMGDDLTRRQGKNNRSAGALKAN